MNRLKQDSAPENILRKRAKRRAYYAKNKDKWARYYREHKEEIRLKVRIYKEENLEKIRAQQKAHRERHKNYLKRYLSDYWVRNKPKLQEYNEKYRTQNGEALSQQKKEYYASNREALIEKVCRWQRENKQRVNDKNRRWKTIKRLETIRAFGSRCATCGYFELIDILEFDHKIPVNQHIRSIIGWREAKKNPDLFQLLCPNCHAKKSMLERRKDIVTTNAIRARERRIRVLMMFESRCSTCGFADVDCLHLDHVIPKFKMGLKINSKTELQALKHPEWFQCLCATCHRIKTLKEVCVDPIPVLV